MAVKGNPFIEKPDTAMTALLSTAVPILSETANLLSGSFDSLPNLGQHFSPFLLASAVSDLKDKLGQVLTMIMLFGFLVGTIRIIGGANQMRRGESEEGKAAIISGALMAAAPLIMKILFEIFFNGGAVIFGG